MTSTENLPQQILDYLSLSSEFNSIALAKEWDVDHQKLYGAIKSLLTNEGVSFSSISSNFESFW